MSRRSPAPYPPLHLADRVCSLDGWGDPYEAYEMLGREHRDALVSLLPHDWRFEGKRVLDFGCGAGRTLRQFLPEAGSGEFWGVDIDAESIEWMRRNLCPPLRVAEGAHQPPLPFDPSTFDLIWALSVFTHLTDTSLEWICDLHRVLKPGALLVASYMGRWNSGFFFPEPWDEDLIGMNELRHDQAWAMGGPSVFMSDWWVREHWGRAFDFVDVAPEVHGQTWALLRRRDVEVSVADLERLADDPRELRALRHNVVQATLDERRARDVLREHYEGSRSWRLTRPLRVGARYMRRLRAAAQALSSR